MVTHTSITATDGKSKEFPSTAGVIPSPYAEEVREGKYPFIEMTFGKETNGVVQNAEADP